LQASVFSNRDKADSLLNYIREAKDNCPAHCILDTAKLTALNALTRLYTSKGELDKAIESGTQANALALNISFKEPASLSVKRLLGNTFNNLGSIYNKRGDYHSAFEKHSKALTIRKEINDRKGMADSYNNIGNTFWYFGNYSKALENYLKALTLREELKDPKGIASAYSNIGMIYKSQHSYDKAMEFYLKSVLINIQAKEDDGLATCYHNIGAIYLEKMFASKDSAAIEENFHKALESHQKGLELQLKIGNKLSAGDDYYTVGRDYLSYAVKLREYKRKAEGSLDKALEYAFKSISETEGSNKRGWANASIIVGDVYVFRKKPELALPYITRALETFKEMDHKSGIREGYLTLSELYELKNDYKQAIDYFKKASVLKDSMLNEESTHQMAEMNAIYESEKKDNEITLLNKDNEKRMIENDRQRGIITTVSVGLLVVLCLAVFAFISYRQKRQAHITISNQKQEVEKKNAIIEAQKHLVEEKNKDITDSINYAKLIQEAMLSSKELKYKLFPDAFVLFAPRDIVSGDFYWFSEKGGKRFIAAVDCTGHGVPGALMSMIGNAFLNEILNETAQTAPSEILSELRYKVIRTLRQTGSEVQSKDGMDIALLAFNESGTHVDYSGANNPLWICRKTGESYSIFEYEPNKRPIGYYMGKSLPFSGHSIDLQKGDTLYIFTDGYADQFGGPAGKKFKYKQLKEVLMSIQEKTMAEQEQILVDTFKSWKGELNQVDDVLVIGVRV
ncbi:MAG: tetratricopeptide repeat protein, partial [Bacteroidia bacterium]